MTLRHRRDRRGLPRARRHPLRGLPGHRPRRPAGAARSRGRGDREAAPDPGGLAGHRSPASRRRATGDRRWSDPSGGAHAPAPPSGRPPQPSRRSRLYVHIPFCVSICPYCDFVVYGRRGSPWPAQPDRRASSAHSRPRSSSVPTRSTCVRPGGPPGRPALGLALHRRRDAIAARPPTTWARRRAGPRRFGLAADAEVTLEANPGPDERGDPPRSARGRHQPDLVRRPEPRRGRAPDGWAGDIAPDDVVDAVAEARAAGIGSINIDLLYDVPDGTLGSGSGRSRRRMAIAPDHLSLYALTLDDPDAEGLTGPGGDHLPTTSGARRWRDAARRAQDEDRAPAIYHHAVHALARAAGVATRSRTGPDPVTRAATTWPTGSAVRTKRSGPVPTRSTGEPALERRAARCLPGRARSARGGTPRLPPGGQ